MQWREIQTELIKHLYLQASNGSCENSERLTIQNSPSAPPAESESGERMFQMSYEEVVASLGMSKTEAQRLLRKKSSKLDELVVPEEFLCPITQDVMKYPVLCSDGFIYEKAAIDEWLVSRRKTSPMTNLPMGNAKMEFQPELLKRIQEFCHNGN